MPYNHTHALMALRALDRADGAAQRLIQPHNDAFLIGALGTDPYFGDGVLPTPFAACAEVLAQKQHAADARALFRALLALSKGNAYLTAYTLGLLCHFLLDAHAHPYIEARFPAKLHTPAEIRMDLMMVQALSDSRAVVPPQKLFKTDRLSELDALHAALNHALFGTELPNAFARSFRKWICINAVTFDAAGKKAKLLSRLAAAQQYLVTFHDGEETQLMNLDRRPWRAPDADAVRTESFPMLFSAAEREAGTLLNLAAEAFQTGDDAAFINAVGKRNMNATACV